ncbi:MAG: riboflavin synthase, partial [Gammaproteobacteria bacterium]
MFTGIIEAIGEVAALEARAEDLRLRVRTGKLSLDDVALGDSISTNGVCLTVTELPGDGYWADVSNETLAHTTLGSLSVGSAVNLEKALLPTSRLGGHLVSGHV